MKSTKAVVNQLFEDNLLSNIAIRVGRKDGILGELYLSKNAEITENTLFDMASVTKVLSVTMLSLIALERGDIGLHDKVNRYFEVPPHNKELEIFHLLTHTTGVGHRSLLGEGNNYDNIAEKILLLEGAPIGTKVDYSCPAFILMGKILEKVYGKRLDVLFKEKVATPLGMKSSTFLPDRSDASRFVNSNLSPDEFGLVNDYNCRFLGGVAGNAGAFSTVSDMTRFAHMLLNGGAPLTGGEIFDLACKNHTPGIGQARGLGFLIVDDAYRQTGSLFKIGSIGHCGHTGQSIFVDRENDLYTIILSDATVSVCKKVGFDAYSKVMAMREKLHNAINKDLEI